MHSNIGVHRECFKKIYKTEDLFDMDIDQRLSQAWQKISSKGRNLISKRILPNLFLKYFII